MASRWIKIEELPELIREFSKLNYKEIAKILGVTQQTLNNWKSGNVDDLKPESRNKLAIAINKNQWGFRVGEYQGGKMEIIYNLPEDNTDERILELQVEKQKLQGLINKLLDENFVLKEKVEKYESNKK